MGAVERNSNLSHQLLHYKHIQENDGGVLFQLKLRPLAQHPILHYTVSK